MKTSKPKAAVTIFILALQAICLGGLLLSCNSKTDLSAPKEKKSDAISPAPKPALPPNLLLITVDTTRADHLGCYGNKAIKTPSIDGLAKEGVLFEEAFSVQPVTLPAHCSIHTGKYPFRHGVHDNSIYQLSEENETMAEMLGQAGYLSTAFVASYILNHRFGLDQGFHYYNDRFVKPKQKGRLPVDRRASEVSFLATEWLRKMNNELQTRPFFLWLHYYDPHADYDPPQPYSSAYGDPYDGEIAYMDDWLGYLFGELKKTDNWDNTMVVLVGDHGEGFGDHGENTHGMFIYRATTHVPLIIKFPHNLHADTRISSRVSQVDILPTVLSTMKLKEKDTVDGVSLLPLITGAEKEHRSVYSETFIPKSFHWSQLRGLRSGEHFFIEAPVPELYRIDVDPQETANLYEQETPTAKSMARDLQNRVSNGAAATSKPVVLTDDMTEQLEQLGYFVAAADVTEDSATELPDPKSRIQLFNTQQKANTLMEAGRNDEALALYESLVKQDANNPRFLMELAQLYNKMGSCKKAEQLYLKAARLDPQNGRLFALMGILYRGWNKPALAVSAFEKALSFNNADYISMFHLSLIAMKRKQYTEAARYLQQAIGIHPSPAAYNNLGYITIKEHHQLEAGIRYLQKAVQLAGNKAPFLYSLGVAYLENGQIPNAVATLNDAVELVPDNVEYISALIRAYRDAGNSAAQQKMEARLSMLQKN